MGISMLWHFQGGGRRGGALLTERQVAEERIARHVVDTSRAAADAEARRHLAEVHYP